MDFTHELNIFSNFRRLISASPDTGIALLVALILFALVLFYRAYTARDPLAAYTPDLVALSISALVSAFVAVGAAGESVLKGSASAPDPTHPIVEWGGVLIGCGAIGVLFWLLSIRFSQMVNKRKRDDLIACTLGWALIGLGSKKALRDRFRETTRKSDVSNDWTDCFFDQELRVGLKWIENGNCPGEAIQDLNSLEKHKSREESTIGGWPHIIANTLHIIAAYLVFTAAATVLREVLERRS